MDADNNTTGSAGASLPSGAIVGITVAAASAAVLVSLGLSKCILRANPKPSGPKDNSMMGDVKLLTTEDDDEEKGSETADAVAAGSTAVKNVLSPEETIERARRLVPCLVRPSLFQRRKSISWNLIRSLDFRLQQMKKEDEEEFYRLQGHGHEVEFCIWLGVEEKYVRDRYQAVRNLQKELGLPSKTNAITAVRHLIYRLGSNNPLGSEDEMDGTLHDYYEGEKWLSYMGFNLNSKNPRKILRDVQKCNQFFQQVLEDNEFVHGTNETALYGIMNDNGKLAPSNHRTTGSESHDFGPGLYAFDSTNETWLHALSFAIDRCWPIPNDEEEGPRFGDEHNPCLVFFKSKPMNRTYKDNNLYRVGEKSPFKEDDLKQYYLAADDEEDKYGEYVASRNKWKEKKNTELYYWKEFVRLARCYTVIPRGKCRFSGFLHHCETTHLTDECDEPTVDPDEWVQHCFPIPDIDIKRALFLLSSMFPGTCGSIRMTMVPTTKRVREPRNCSSVQSKSISLSAKNVARSRQLWRWRRLWLWPPSSRKENKNKETVIYPLQTGRLYFVSP